MREADLGQVISNKYFWGQLWVLWDLIVGDTCGLDLELTRDSLGELNPEAWAAEQFKGQGWHSRKTAVFAKSQRQETRSVKEVSKSQSVRNNKDK